MPSAEIDATPGLVRALLGVQHPDLAGLPVRLVANGWDNALFRLGDDLAVRLPRRAASAALVEHEQTWLPHLARTLPVVVPAPVRVGRPGPGFPWSWSVTRWVEGRVAASVPPAGRRDLAEPLADVLVALHQPAPPEAPRNPYRGVPLAERDAAVTERLAALPEGSRLVGLWQQYAAAPGWTGPPLWLHGDLHPLNIVVDDAHHLAAVIDFGDLCSGDPATDLATAWLTFDAVGRAAFGARIDAGRAAAGLPPHGAATWQRARGWALVLGSVLAGHDDEASVMRDAGQHTLTELLAGR